MFSMSSEGLGIDDAPLAARYLSVADSIWNFRPRAPHHHPSLFGGEASIPYERILARVARGREAIDLSIGEGLRWLEDHDALMGLGYSKMTDYAREVLGLAPTTARNKVKLARALTTRPFLRQAVRAGNVSARKALEVLPVAKGDAEKAWVLLAGTLSVRELRRAVARALGRASGETGSSAAAPDEEPWRVLSFPLRPEDRAVVAEALRLAGELLGRGAPTWMRLEAMAQEFLGSHPAEVGEDELGAPPWSRGIPLEDLEKALEIESNGWDWLEAVEPVAAPELGEMEPEALDARLRDLVEKRKSWDEVFGAMAWGFALKRLACKLGFADLGQYLKERLGMSRRAFEQRVWLERRMEELPQLRYSLERGEVSYEKARLVANVADFDSVNEWIRRAGRMTCAEVERSVEAARDAQVCARDRFEARMPRRVAGLLGAALRAAAETGEAPADPGRCLAVLARHFVETWGPLVKRRISLSRAIQERDGGWCKIPGCSRPSAQDHHLVFRSHGGGNGPENQVAVCAPHHLRGIHGGLIRVSGTAPDHLVWELADGTPLGPRPVPPSDAPASLH